MSGEQEYLPLPQVSINDAIKGVIPEVSILPIPPVAVPDVPDMEGPSIWELLYARYYFTLINEVKAAMEGKTSMPDYKTTLSGFILGLAPLLAIFGIVIPPIVSSLFVLIGSLALGYFAKDKTAAPAPSPAVAK